MKSVITVSLLLGLISGLLPAQVNIPFEEYTLPNGLKVILHEDNSVPITAFNIWYHVGSAYEKPGRTGFAHLFEHMLFQGSQNVGDDQHFGMIQEAGGSLNGSTNNDRTNYFETVPSNFSEMVLWLEADRMGFLLPAMTQEKLDNQRDVVKNERRQRVDNQPYGRSFERLHAMLYEPSHPYSWPVIGSMTDLSAASLEDVKEFFRLYYAPNNSSLVIAGEFEKNRMKELVGKYFGDIPRGAPIDKLTIQQPTMMEDKRETMEDRVQLARLYLYWHSNPLTGPDDAALDILADVLSGGKNSRLYKALVYEKQIAQSVSASQISRSLAGVFGITVTAKPGVGLTEIQKVVDEEIERLIREGVTEREFARSQNSRKSDFIYGLQSIGGKAEQLNSFNVMWGDPAALNRELDRYVKVTLEDVRKAAATYLTKGRAILSVVPMG
jgi:zinc protease